MGSASIAFTTRGGKILFLKARHPLLTSVEDVVSAMRPYLAHRTHREIIDVRKIPFLLEKKRFFLFFSLWRFYEKAQPFLLYGLKRAILSYPWPACILCQKEGKALLGNSALAQVLGCLSSQIEGISFWSLFENPPVPKEEFREKIYKIKTTQGYFVPVTISHMIPEGEYVAVFIFPADLQHTWTSMGDHFLINQLPLPAAFLDEHGGIRHVNNLLKEKITVPCPGSLGQWLSEKGRQSFAKNLTKLRKDPQLFGQQRIVIEGNDQRPLSVVFKYFPGCDERAPGQFLTLFLVEDVPAPSTKEADPQKLQMLGQLASGIVHDFNNLLTGILGFCDLLLQRHSQEDPSFRDIEQIKQSAMRAARLIQQLLAFSKASAPSQVAISLTQCIKDLFPLMRRMVGPKILLSLEEKSSSNYVIYGDSGQLDQILLNLAINARDAMTDGGSLVFCLDEVTFRQQEKVVKGWLSPGKYIILTVKDSGTGIEEHHLERIFDPFFSTKDQGQGTGLGLSNVLQMMEQFQGGVTIQSTVGIGTTFSLYFPEYKGQGVYRQAPVETISAIQREGQDPKNIRILLVEDEDPVRLFAARALRQKGYEVIEARDGGQALKLLQGDASIQVIVTDVMMPGIDGPSLAVMSHEINPRIKILFVSGYPEEEVKSHLPTTLKEVYFLPKPFALADLVNKIGGFFE